MAQEQSDHEHYKAQLSELLWLEGTVVSRVAYTTEGICAILPHTLDSTLPDIGMRGGGLQGMVIVEVTGGWACDRFPDAFLIN